MIITLKKIIVFIGLTLILPFYVVCTCVLYVWYTFVSLLGKHVKRFEYSVTGIDTFFSPDNVFKKPTATLIHISVLEGTPDLETVTRDLYRLYESKNSNQSRKYDQLGFSIETWMGYVFWKKVKDFQIQNYIHFLHDPQIDDTNIARFVETLMRKPFVPNEPLWEIFFISKDKPKEGDDDMTNNNNSNQCYVVFRTHHILMDGMSLVKLWYKADGSQFPQDLIKFSTSPTKRQNDTTSLDMSSVCIKRLWKNLKMFLFAPYLSNRVLCNPNDRNCLTKTFKDFDGEWFCSEVNKINLAKYRQPLRKLKFTLTHAVLVGYTRGFRRFIENHYGRDSIPQRVHIMGSIPLSQHPDDILTNHWTIMRYKAGLCINSILKELEQAKAEYTRAVNDIIPDTFAFMIDKIRFLPGKFHETIIETKNYGTLSLSNIPGPQNQQKMFGLTVTDRMIWLPLSRNNSGIALLFLTYNGWGNIAMTADSGCIQNRKLFQELNKLVMEEIQTVLDKVVEITENNKYSVELGDLVDVKVL